MNCNSIKYIPILLLLVCTSVEAKRIEAHILNFGEIGKLDIDKRKKYLKFLVDELSKEKLIEVTFNKQNKTFFCPMSLYGERKKVKKIEKCNQKLKKAALFFAYTKNQSEWARLRFKLNMSCLNNEKCNNFFVKHKKKINKMRVQ